jgi:hypothetical protein
MQLTNPAQDRLRADIVASAERKDLLAQFGRFLREMERQRGRDRAVLAGLNRSLWPASGVLAGEAKDFADFIRRLAREEIAAAQTKGENHERREEPRA